MGNSQEIAFQEILNFRDLGGYTTRSGRSIARRRIFRSGDLSYATKHDIAQLKDTLKIKTVLDLRNEEEITHQQKTRPAVNFSPQYRNVLFVTGENDDLKVQKLMNETTELADVYLYFVHRYGYGRKIVKALEIIADPNNHPVIFHCSAGKDRTGVLAAFLLNAVGVSDVDIIRDYATSAEWINRHIARASQDEEFARMINEMPAYINGSTPASMRQFLTALHHEYDSIPGYLAAHDADSTLSARLAKALLV